MRRDYTNNRILLRDWANFSVQYWYTLCAIFIEKCVVLNVKTCSVEILKKFLKFEICTPYIVGKTQLVRAPTIF